jgi:hypothetical protein
MGEKVESRTPNQQVLRQASAPHGLKVLYLDVLV